MIAIDEIISCGCKLCISHPIDIRITRVVEDGYLGHPLTGIVDRSWRDKFKIHEIWNGHVDIMFIHQDFVVEEICEVPL